MGLCLMGCGLLTPVVTELVGTPEGMTVEQRDEQLPLELRFGGELRGWRYLERGGIWLRSGTVLGVRSPGLTMFSAVLQLRSSGGYRLLLGTTPRAWQRGQPAPVELTVVPGRLVVRSAAGVDTLELPGGGSYRWQLVQRERGIEVRFECLPPRWIPRTAALTEWILLEPLSGAELVLEGMSIRPLLPVEQAQSQ